MVETCGGVRVVAVEWLYGSITMSGVVVSSSFRRVESVDAAITAAWCSSVEQGRRCW